MPNFKDMSKEEKLRAIEDRYIKATDGDNGTIRDRLMSPGYDRTLVNKVDPEADAEMSINKSVTEPKSPIPGAEDMSKKVIMVNGQPMDMATAARTINPQTGLPYSVGMNDQPNAEDEKAKMKLQYLRDMAASGKLRR